MLPLFTAVILILALLDSVHAHFVWLERDGDGPVRAYFGEWITISGKKPAACSTGSKRRGFFSAQAKRRCRSSAMKTIWSFLRKAVATCASWTLAFRRARTRKKAA